MTWEMIGSSGEWAGAIAVVTTLFYLARQIQQQNKIAKYGAWQSFMMECNKLNLSYDSSRLRILRQGFADPDVLSDEDAVEFAFILRVYHNTMMMGFRAYQSGFISEQDWDQIAQAYGGDIDSPGGQKWREGQGIFADFFEDIDKRYKGELRVDLFLGRAGDAPP